MRERSAQVLDLHGSKASTPTREGLAEAWPKPCSLGPRNPVVGQRDPGAERPPPLAAEVRVRVRFAAAPRGSGGESSEASQDGAQAEWVRPQFTYPPGCWPRSPQFARLQEVPSGAPVHLPTGGQRTWRAPGLKAAIRVSACSLPELYVMFLKCKDYRHVEQISNCLVLKKWWGGWKGDTTVKSNLRDPCDKKCSVLTELFATPWTVACQKPQSMGFSRQEYWSGLPFSFPELMSTIPQFKNWWRKGEHSIHGVQI